VGPHLATRPTLGPGAPRPGSAGPVAHRSRTDFAGYEFSDQTDPFEAGIGFSVPLKSKTDDFIGRDALLRRSAHPSHKLVGLHLGGNEAAHHGDPVYHGRAQVGVITSACRSPLLARQYRAVPGRRELRRARHPA